MSVSLIVTRMLQCVCLLNMRCFDENFIKSLLSILSIFVCVILRFRLLLQWCREREKPQGEGKGKWTTIWETVGGPYWKLSDILW